MGAFLASYSDAVLGAGGVAVAGATVTCYPTSAFALGTLPTGTAPGPTPTATAVTDANGQFTLTGLPPDDYHLLVVATPPGGTATANWRYNVPILAYDAVRRVVGAERAGALPRVLSRLAAGQPIVIFCAGDEVTMGAGATGTVAGGWVALLAARLAALYPHATVSRQDPINAGVTQDGPIPGWTPITVQTGSGVGTITVVNGGVQGDTVLRFLRRFANLTTSWPAADLLIAGFGLNESTTGAAQQYEGAVDFAAHLESLVNIVRTLSQAEVLLCTPALSTGAIDDYAAAVRTVAARAGCDLADLRQLFLDRYTAGGPDGGYDPWLNTALSSVLPTDLGHAAIAGEIARHFAPLTAVPFAGGPYGAGKSWEMDRLPFGAAQIAYGGSGWTTHTGYQGSALSASGGQSEGVTNHPGDSLTIGGRFSELSLLCRRFSDCGQIGVRVDGGPSTTIDLYRAYPTSTSDLTDSNGASAPQERVLLAHGLADVVHTVTVTLLSTINPASTGTYWRVEALEVGRWRRHGYQVEANEAQTRIQQGTVTFPFVSQSSVVLVITFPQPFTAPPAAGVLPAVVATSLDPAYEVAAGAITLTGFNLTLYRRDGTTVTANPGACWVGLG
jgi:lysophospholipase L1-like esterase